MGRWLSVALGHVLRALVSIVLGFGGYWMAEQMLLRSGNGSLERAAVWLSPISIFGWVTLALLITVSAAAIYRLWPRRS
jgi:hypothetical protein